MSRRKKILIHSNNHSAFTGFGKNCKNILKYLYKTGKYELFELANGLVWSENDSSSPWKVYGSLPNDAKLLASLKSDPVQARSASYGLLTVDKAIEKIQPDVYIGIEDIWAFSETVNKPWWNKTNCMIWTTLDSLPILPDAVRLAPKIKNYYCWSSFAETAMKKLGINHVKTLHGSIDESHFFRLEDENRKALRNRFGIDTEAFVIGFVFRNQLRKTVSDLIIGFKLFKNKFPESFAKLLLHTNWAEGWDIPRLLNENGVKTSDVLTSYHCKNCKHFSVMPFSGQPITCPVCGAKESFSTTSVTNGVSEEQLNEVYNLMDMYVHPFTSGGQEIPIQEAKLTELITAVTNYTCGEEMCSPESGGIPLSWFPYREIGTQFVKASTSPMDISAKIESVYSMDKEKARALGKKSRQYILDNYSFNAVGKRLEDIIDAMPEISFDFTSLNLPPDPSYTPKNNYPSEIDFIKDLYKSILRAEVENNDEGLINWVNKIRSGVSPSAILNYFRQTAKNELAKKNPPSVEDFVDKNDKTPKIALVVPNDVYIALLCGFFIEPLKIRYPNHKLYVFSDKSFWKIFNAYSEHIEKMCPIVNNCENQLYMEGSGENAGLFDVCYVVNKNNLSLSAYSHNAKDL